MSDALKGRVLLVHAHPDDETLATGALIASLVEQGSDIGLVTATRGEQGEIVAGALDDLPEPIDLSEVRERELQGALDALGVGWHAYLGTAPARAPGQQEHRYADSGMRWIRPGLAGPAEDVGPEALTSAPIEDVVDDLAAAIEAYRPDIVVTYDDDGGYGHPDHLRCHDATVAACRRTGVPLYLTVAEDGEPSAAVDGDLIVVDGVAHLATIKQALDAHRTQLTVDGDDVVHSGGQREPILTRVAVRRAR